MQVLFQLRNPTTDGRQGNPEVAAGGRETPGIDRSQQDGHRLQSIHGIPSTNERVLPETTSYLTVLGGLYRSPKPRARCRYSRMSALGQKQTYAVHQSMSALPPKATVKADMTHRVGAVRPSPTMTGRRLNH